MSEALENQSSGTTESTQKQRGGAGYVLLWLLGVPLPVLILIALVRGCA